MKTKLTIYKPNTLENGKFAALADYGWDLAIGTSNTGNSDQNDPDFPFVKVDGSLSKVANTQGGTASQLKKLRPGVDYRCRFTLANWTSGILRLKTFTSTIGIGGDFLVPSIGANGIYDATFTSQGESFAIVMANAFDGTFYNFSIVEIPESYDLDVSDDVDVPLNFSIDSIADPQQRKTTFSKSIKLAGTHTNNIAFDHIYKVNSESLFNPNLKTKVIIQNDGINCFEGVMCLDEITKTLQFGSESVEYAVTVYGESLNIFDRMGEKTIKDLDFSMYDHEFTEGRIYASWGNDIKLFGSYGAQNRDLTYTSPAISSIAGYSGNQQIRINFSGTHSFSAGDDIYIDCNQHQMFGDQQVMSVINSTSIAIKVPVWWSGGAPAVSGTCSLYPYMGIGYWYPMADFGRYETVAEPPLVVGRYYYIERAGGSDDFTNVGAVDNQGGRWFIATGTTPNSWVSGSTVLYTYDPTHENIAKHDRAKSATVDDTVNHWVPTDFVPCIFAYEVFVKICAMLGIKYNSDIIDSQFFKRIVIPLNAEFDLFDVRTSGELQIGRRYMIYDWVTGDDFTNVGAASNADLVIFTATGDTPSIWSNGSKVAMMVNMNDWLPGMKLKDFFLGILNAFNLALIEDAEIKNLIHLVNRDEFSSGDIVDWSDKLDTGSPLKITMSNKILPTYYHLKYKDGEDFFNLDYNRDFGNRNNLYGNPQQIDRKYGDQPIFNTAEFAQESKTVEIPWTPTILAGPIQPVVSAGSVISDGVYAGSDKNISVCYNADADGSNVKRANADRLLFVAIKGTADQWSFNSEGTPAEDISDYTQGSYGTRAYPWAGHTDPNSNTHCILFGIPLANYSNVSMNGVYTLYGKYWLRYLNTINSPHARIVEGTFKLSALDIYNVDFSKSYKVGDLVLTLKKITDWNANSDGLCQCEFMIVI